MSQRTEVRIRRKTDGAVIRTDLTSIQAALEWVSKAAPDTWMDLYAIDMRVVGDWTEMQWTEVEV